MYGNYMPFESRILSDNFDFKKKQEKIIKGKEIKTDPGKKPESLLAQQLEPQIEGGIGSLDNVKERSESGDIYYGPNSCIGEWSDWNKDNCGTERSRCGIMFKRYTVHKKHL